MSVYHQMGHDSVNLLEVPELQGYAGAVLSPVNYSENDIIVQMQRLRDRTEFETVFDPQLYYPSSERGHLPGWAYFPSSADTADIQSSDWWSGVAGRLAEVCERLSPTAACSPVFAAPVYNDDYYGMMTQVGDRFAEALAHTSIRPMQTVITNISDLSQENRPFEIASIVSRTRAKSIYLIFMSDVQPRRELRESTQLSGGMRLIAALRQSGLNVTVGYSSSEFVLWKHAGAANCCTGKFFNLRRFTPSRFDEPSEGGGQLPYWFEEGLLAFLRESDVIRVQRLGMLSEVSLSNPFSGEILDLIVGGQPWLAKSWRHYMYGFYDLEARIRESRVHVPGLLLDAENRWLALEDRGVLMEEARNNGDWIRAWRRAISEM